ncbi:MAG: hypothetical protein ACTSVI_13710 [Promethearchaeota archaeon]
MEKKVYTLIFVLLAITFLSIGMSLAQYEGLESLLNSLSVTP